jgi:hypothetical protein
MLQILTGAFMSRHHLWLICCLITFLVVMTFVSVGAKHLVASFGALAGIGLMFAIIGFSSWAGGQRGPWWLRDAGPPRSAPRVSVPAVLPPDRRAAALPSPARAALPPPRRREASAGR